MTLYPVGGGSPISQNSCSGGRGWGRGIEADRYGYYDAGFVDQDASGRGMCGANFRRCRVKVSYGGKSANVLAIPDTGTNQIGQGFMMVETAQKLGINYKNLRSTPVQTEQSVHTSYGPVRVSYMFDPNPNPVTVSMGIVSWAAHGDKFDVVPMNSFLQRVNILLSKNATVWQSAADPSKSVTYDCRTDQIAQGDLLKLLPGASAKGFDYEADFARGGGTGGKCIQAGVTYLNGRILDTGSPSDGPAEGGAPAPFVNMNTLYPSNNVVYTHDSAYIIPARNNVATTQNYTTVSACPNGPAGFGFRRPGHGFRGADDQGTGYCGGNFRRLRMQMQSKNGQWTNQTALIDSGTAIAMLTQQKARELGVGGSSGGGGGRGYRGGGGGGGGDTQVFQIQTKFDPNTQPINMPCAIHDQDQGNLFIPSPIATITQRVKLVLTQRYTISISLGQGGNAISYDCQTNKVTKGDILSGSWAPTK
jgi:hypothetical protein